MYTHTPPHTLRGIFGTWLSWCLSSGGELESWGRRRKETYFSFLPIFWIFYHVHVLLISKTSSFLNWKQKGKFTNHEEKESEETKLSRKLQPLIFPELWSEENCLFLQAIELTAETLHFSGPLVSPELSCYGWGTWPGDVKGLGGGTGIKW